MSDFTINVEGLSKSFNGQLAVDNIQLQVEKGEIFGFLGPNGGGKTTTIRMLCGLLTPDKGSGDVLGYDIIKQADDIRAVVGYMTQQFSLYVDLTVYENLDFVARIYQVKDRIRRLEQLMNELNLTPYRNKLVGTLSGGWKQRVALAAALVHQPRILMLDEPTSGVDPKARKEFWEKVHQLSDRGITVLVTTHYMDEAQRCNRLAYFSHGHLLAVGTADELIKHAALTTWWVSGPQLAKLSKTLEQLPGVVQVVAFGRNLHVSGTDPQALEGAIKPFQELPEYHWRPALTDIEDVFIYLVTGGREEMHAE